MNSRDRTVFRPRLLECLRVYTRQDFTADLAAGITVGIVALPLATAFGIASGVRPEAGLVTAVIAGFLISALGGSSVQIGGPTGAFVAIVYGIIATYGLDSLLICTIMAGLILIVMGLTGMGNMIKYIPYPVTAGFTSGIAILILSTQVKDFFGLDVATVPPEFAERLVMLVRNISTTHAPTLALSVTCLLIILFWPRSLARRVPGSIAAMIAATVAVYALNLPVETIGSRFGDIPRALPSLHLPAIDWPIVRTLVQPAFAIALLGAIESLLSAVVADGMTGERHNSNQELIAQGVANVVSPLFGGITATGAVARTATNIKAGARTPVAGIIHALVLLVIMLVGAPLAKHIPLAGLSAVLIVVAYNMGEWREFGRAIRMPRSDAAVLFTVFALTLVVDLTVAVEVGMILAGVLFIRRVAENTIVTRLDGDSAEDSLSHSIVGKDVPEGVIVFRVFGAFLFGATEKLERAMRSIGEDPKVLILRLRTIIAIDATGLNAVERLLRFLRERNQMLVLSGTQAQPLEVMERAGLVGRIGRENVCPNIEVALERARQIVEGRRSAGG